MEQHKLIRNLALQWTGTDDIFGFVYCIQVQKAAPLTVTGLLLCHCALLLSQAVLQ